MNKMNFITKIKKELSKQRTYRQFEKAIKNGVTHIKKLDIVYDKQLGITRNIISLAYKYNLPVIVNDNKVAHKQYLSRIWFDSDTRFIKLSDILERKYESMEQMALCDLDDATYNTLPDLDELHRFANVIIGAAKIDYNKEKKK